MWAGSPTHDNAHNRDIPLAHLLRLTEIPGVELHSLQVGAGAQQFSDLGCYGLIADRAPEMTNFLDTARVLAGLDLLITVDTATAHLAGAMGMPCWMLVNQKGTDFRWGRGGDATGWYPSIKIYRRSLLEQTWVDAIGRVDHDLRALCG